MRKLIIKDTLKEIPIGECLTIGSLSSNNIQLKGKQVEERHARLIKSGERVYIEDLDSRHGLTVNSKKVMRWALKKDDVIEIGGSTLVYSEDDRPEPQISSSLPKPELTKSAAPQITPLKPAPSQSASLKSAAIGIDGAQPAKISVVASDIKSPLMLSSKPGSSSRRPSPTSSAIASAPSASGQTRAPDSNIPCASVASRAALKAISSLNVQQPSQQIQSSDAKSKLRLILAIVGLLAACVCAIVFHVSRGSTRVEGDTPEERESLTRLRTQKLKETFDLTRVRLLIQKARVWKDIENLLGEPDLTMREKIPLYRDETGTFDQRGDEFKAYYIRDAIESNNDKASPLAAILLFEVHPDNRVELFGSRYYSREKLLPKVEREALARIKVKGPKEPQDLLLVKSHMQKARAWKDVENLLGEPDLIMRGKIPLYTDALGTYDQYGYEFRVYYVRELTGVSNNKTESIILFKVHSDNRVEFLDRQQYSREKLPPKIKAVN